MMRTGFAVPGTPSMTGAVGCGLRITESGRSRSCRCGGSCFLRQHDNGGGGTTIGMPIHPALGIQDDRFRNSAMPMQPAPGWRLGAKKPPRPDPAGVVRVRQKNQDAAV